MKKFTKILLALFLCATAILTFSACSLQGKSAYEIAVENGYTGTVTEWLNSLKGADGQDGKNGADGKDGEVLTSLYTEAQQNGFEGTFEEFLTQYVKGDKGDKGENGTQVSQYATNKAITSVVSVYATFNTRNTLSNTATSGGSGVIYNLDKENGNAIIITNYHVVYLVNSTDENHISSDIKVRLYGMELDKYSINATYVGGSLNYDIAVLKVENSELIKNSNVSQADINENYYVGDSVIAIGNPEAKGISATSGIVSVDSENLTMVGADNATSVTFRVLRTDTAINEGNSGGGLFNANGELIGIVNAKTISQNIDNMGYAIPSVVAKNVADNILRNYISEPTKVKKQTFGITLKVDESLTEFNTEINKVEIKQKIIISEITENSVAQKAGLKVNDEVVSYTYKGTTKQVTRVFHLVDASLTIEENTTITINIIRDGEELAINILADSLTIIE